MSNALRQAARGSLCRQCGEPVILVDVTNKKGGGGQWVHLELPETPHPAGPQAIKEAA